MPATSQFVHTENVPKMGVCCGCTYGLGKDNTAWKTAWHCFLPLSFGSCAVFFLGSWIEEAAGHFPRSLATLHLEMDWEADPVLLITLLPSRKRAGKHREAFAEEEVSPLRQFRGSSKAPHSQIPVWFPWHSSSQHHFSPFPGLLQAQPQAHTRTQLVQGL